MQALAQVINKCDAQYPTYLQEQIASLVLAIQGNSRQHAIDCFPSPVVHAIEQAELLSLAAQRESAQQSGVNLPEKAVAPSASGMEYSRAEQRQHLADLVTQLTGAHSRCSDTVMANQLREIIVPLMTKLQALI